MPERSAVLRSHLRVVFCEASVALHNLSKVEDTEIAQRAVAARDRAFDSVRQHMVAVLEQCAKAYGNAEQSDDHGRFNELLEHLNETEARLNGLPRALRAHATSIPRPASRKRVHSPSRRYLHEQ